MPEPPDDLDDLLAQLGVVLDSMSVPSGPDREELLRGVREALHAAGLGNGIAEGFGDGFAEGPSVTVLEGGKRDDAGQQSRQGPHLEVLPDPPTDEVPKAGAGVRVFTMDELGRVFGGTGRSTRRGDGAIAVDGGAWQTVFRGPEPRAYRVWCDQGCLDLAVDGVKVERLSPGQSIDIEAGLIRVTSEEALSKGRYARL